MAEQIISSYGAKFGFTIDKASVTAIYSQIDAIKTKIENKLNTTLRINKIVVAPDALAGAKSRISKSLNIGVSIDKITITNDALAKAKKRLEAAMKGAFKDASSTGLEFPINRFKVDAVQLRKQVQTAFDSGVVLKVDAVKGAGRKAASGSTTTELAQGGFFQRLGQQARAAWTPGAPGRPHALSIGQSGLGYGLLAGMTSIVPGVAAIAGVMQLNNISEQMQASKVALGTITKGRGQETFDWLRKTGNETGMNYREQLPMFSNYLSGAINKQGYDASLQSFKDISLYGMTHGATNESMKGATRALSQMWSKGKVQAEELTNQLSEATGFGGSKELFAQAYQESIGGKLTGQKADAALIKAMKDGNVLTAKVLPIVTRLMAEKAAGGLTAYQATTQFQHGRFSNAFSDLVLTLGKGGFDEGMSKVFKTLSDAMESNAETVKNLGARFKDLSVIFEGVIGQSSRIIKGFTDMTGTFGSVLAVGLALYKLIGKKGSIFGLLILALDDLDAYVSGGDSVLGKFIGYMTDLTGMDWNAISLGIGAVGIAIGLAFAPLTTLALSIGALIIAYKYLQDLKAKEKPIVPGSTSLPTTNELRAQNANMAGKDWDKNPSLGNALNVGWANSVGWLTDIGGYVSTAEGTDFGTPRPYAKTINKLQGFLDKGVISSDEYTRAAASLGSGYKTADSIEAWLGSRTSSFGDSNAPFYKPQAPVMQFSGDIIVNGATDPENFANSLMHFYVPEGTAAKSTP